MYVGNTESVFAYGRETVNFEMKLYSKWHQNRLTKVCNVTEISKNILIV